MIKYHNAEISRDEVPETLAKQTYILYLPKFDESERIALQKNRYGQPVLYNAGSSAYKQGHIK